MVIHVASDFFKHHEAYGLTLGAKTKLTILAVLQLVGNNNKINTKLFTWDPVPVI